MADVRKTVTKTLKQPVTVGHFLLVLATVAVTVLMLGASGEDPKMVYRTNTLTPAPIQSPETAPVVKTEVITETNTPVVSEAPSTAKTPETTASGNNCVSFVCAMAPGLCQQGNAGTWRSNSSNPSVGAVMIFRPGQQGASGYGHVGLVTSVSGSTVTLAHANWSGGQTTFQSTGNFYR